MYQLQVLDLLMFFTFCFPLVEVCDRAPLVLIALKQREGSRDKRWGGRQPKNHNQTILRKSKGNDNTDIDGQRERILMVQSVINVRDYV